MVAGTVRGGSGVNQPEKSTPPIFGYLADFFKEIPTLSVGCVQKKRWWAIPVGMAINGVPKGEGVQVLASCILSHVCERMQLWAPPSPTQPGPFGLTVARKVLGLRRRPQPGRCSHNRPGVWCWAAQLLRSRLSCPAPRAEALAAKTSGSAARFKYPDLGGGHFRTDF